MAIPVFMPTEWGGVLKRLLILAALGLVSLSGLARAEKEIEIKPFLAMNYTLVFSKKVSSSFHMQVAVGGRKVEVVMTARQERGKSVHKFGEDWLGVETIGTLIVGKKKTQLRSLDLYDEKTLQLRHSISLVDDSISSYEWGYIPEVMQMGQRIRVGQVEERDAEGKLLGTGNVFFTLAKKPTRFEFCTIEETLIIETGQEEFFKECDRFSFSNQLRGSSFEMRRDRQLEVVGLGSARVVGVLNESKK